MKKYSILIILLSLFCSSKSFSQEEALRNTRSLTIGVGWSLQTIKDSRLSALTYRSRQPTYHIGWRKQTSSTRQELDLTFSMKSSVKSERILDLRFFKPSFSYSLEKRVNDAWIGGFFNTTTFLTFPSSRTGHFSNNPVSYTMTNSIGPKMSWGRSWEVNDVERFRLMTSAETSLLSYVVRPAYGHPYPERFLQSGTFTPTREGMAGPLLRSGKLMSINKFQSFKVVFSLSYFMSDELAVWGEGCR